MVGQHFFHRAGRQAVAGNIDHVVCPRHDIDITIFVDHAGVTGFVIAGERGQIGFAVPCLGVPQVWQGARGQWQFDCNSAKITGGQRIAALVQNLHVIARHRHRRRSHFNRQRLNPDRVTGNRPSGFGLPPMVNNRNAQQILRPMNGIWVGTLSGKIQRFKA